LVPAAIKDTSKGSCVKEYMSTKRGSTSFTFNSGCRQVPYKFCPKVYTSPVAKEEELDIILEISVDLEEPKEPFGSSRSTEISNRIS
jgi:hypothetical protein